MPPADPEPFDEQHPTVVLPPPAPRIMPDPVVAEPSEPIDLFEERRGDMDQLEEELRRMEAPLRAAVAADEEDPFREIPVEGEASPEEPAETVGEPSPADEPFPEGEDPFREIVLHSDADEPAEEPSEISGEESAGEEPAADCGEDELVVTVTDNEVKVLDEAEIDQSLYDPLKDLIYYRKPTPGLLENYPVDSKVTDQEIFDNKNRIKEILNSFGIPIQKINATTGPTVKIGRASCRERV